MKLQLWPVDSFSGVKKHRFDLLTFMSIYRFVSYSSTVRAASEIKLSDEEFVSKLLNRRWTLKNPDSKIHQITLSVTKRELESGIFGGIKFSVDTDPKLGESITEKWCKDPSFYIVRDDLLHPLVNGNKARKLDAVLPIVEGYSGTDVVTCGGCQSAHAAAVAVSCAENGLKSHLLLRGEEPEILTGYNLISTLYGHVTYVPRSRYAKREEMLARHANMVAGANGSVAWLRDILNNFLDSSDGPNDSRASSDRGSGDCPRKVVIINEGAGDVVGLLGVIRLVRYLSQPHILGKDKPYTFVVDAGTGTTAIGLALGALCLRLPWKVTAVMLADTIDGYKKQETRLISEFEKYSDPLLISHAFDGRKYELVNWVDRKIPRKFGNVLDGEVEACQQVANETGVLVDPIYTLAGWELATDLSQKEPKDGAKVVMMHTGGTLAMFGLAQRYKSYFRTLKGEPLK